MTIQEIKDLIKQVKFAIIEANDRADYFRVDQLKNKKRLLKKKLNEHLANNRHSFRTPKDGRIWTPFRLRNQDNGKYKEVSQA